MSERRALQRTKDLPWVETTATVISSDYQETAWGGVKDRGQSLNYFVTRFTYKVSGAVYHGELRSAELRQLGSKFNIRYDPTNPNYNSVTGAEKPIWGRLVSWTFVILGLLIFFLILRYLI